MVKFWFIIVKRNVNLSNFIFASRVDKINNDFVICQNKDRKNTVVDLVFQGLRLATGGAIVRVDSCPCFLLARLILEHASYSFSCNVSHYIFHICFVNIRKNIKYIMILDDDYKISIQQLLFASDPRYKYHGCDIHTMFFPLFSSTWGPEEKKHCVCYIQGTCIMGLTHSSVVVLRFCILHLIIMYFVFLE